MLEYAYTDNGWNRLAWTESDEPVVIPRKYTAEVMRKGWMLLTSISNGVQTFSGGILVFGAPWPKTTPRWVVARVPLFWSTNVDVHDGKPFAAEPLMLADQIIMEKMWKRCQRIRRFTRLMQRREVEL